MKEILEDAAVVYRHEAESLLIIAAPAIVLGPFFVLIASTGLRAAIASVPVLMIVYLLTYAATLRAAKLVYDNGAPDPTRAYVEALWRLPSLIVAFAPIAIVMAAAAVAALIIANEGFAMVAFGVGLAGGGAGLVWLARHIYDLPLIIGYDVGGLEALETGRRVMDTAPTWTSRIVVALGLPLAVVWLLCWGLWVALAPAFGAVLFAAVASLWMPFVALSLTGACMRIVSEEPVVEEPVPA